MDTLIERRKGSFGPPVRNNTPGQYFAVAIWVSKKLIMTSASNVALVSMSENSFDQNKSN